MVFDQTVHVCNASSEKIYVRTTYEKWQQLKFSTEVKLLSGISTGGGLNFEQARSDFTEGFTALAPHHTLKMIGSFFSAEADKTARAGAGAGDAGAVGEGVCTKRLSISRNYRVPNRHAIIVTPQQTLQVVRGGDQWKKRCREFCACAFVFREKKKSSSVWQRMRRSPPEVKIKEACLICGRGGRSSAKP